jgi:TonB-dependent Receptor Plug Domain
MRTKRKRDLKFSRRAGGMGQVKAPRSLRSHAALHASDERSVAAASFSGAEAQQAPLPPVTVDAPVARPRPATSKPTPDQVRARNALRRAARRTQPTQVAPVPFPDAGALSADRNPYADPAAPYKVDHLQASGKFPEPLVNTPKTVTVLSKEVLEDENTTSLKRAVLNTAGVTLGTGEGGNAFGDRFFIRGFDARNDVFIDGVRDSGVTVRENFFTEQVEILRGPASSFAGRAPPAARSTSSPSRRRRINPSTTRTRRLAPTAPSASPSTSIRSSARRWRFAPAACSRMPVSPAGTTLPTIAAAALPP